MIIPSDRPWTYLKLYPYTLGSIDRLVGELPRLALATAGSTDQPWFFIRFIDASGYHLRLRVHRSPDMGWRDSVDEFSRAVERTDTQLLQLTPGFYSPEILKFPATELPLHEGIFERMSNLAAHLSSRPQTAQVSSLYRLYQAGGALPALNGPSFLYMCSWYWGRKTPQFRVSAAAGATRNLDYLRDHASSLDPEIKSEVDSIAHVLDAACSQARNPWMTAFHHLHLAANRMGVMPLMESAIAANAYLEKAA